MSRLCEAGPALAEIILHRDELLDADQECREPGNTGSPWLPSNTQSSHKSGFLPKDLVLDTNIFNNQMDHFWMKPQPWLVQSVDAWGVPGVQPADAIVGLHRVCESLHVLHLQGLHQTLVAHQHFQHTHNWISSRGTIGFSQKRRLDFCRSIGYFPAILSSFTEKIRHSAVDQFTHCNGN